MYFIFVYLHSVKYEKKTNLVLDCFDFVDILYEQ